MGLGDELMAAGHARWLSDRRGGGKVEILDRVRQRRWHGLWERMPWVARPGERDVVGGVVNGPGVRPYIARSSPARWTWADYTCHPCPIVLTDDERAFGARAAGLVLLAPAIKRGASPNKLWPTERWRALARLLMSLGAPVAQLEQPGGDDVALDVPVRLAAPTLWHAGALIAAARCLITHEGALHHLAAGLAARSVVIRGGYVGVRQTGYGLACQLELAAPGDACGWRIPCEHCIDAMAAITPERVARAVLEGR